MKNIRILLALIAVFGLVPAAGAQSVDEQIAERIEKVGSVCVEGQDCGAAGASADDASGGNTTVAAAGGGAGEVEATYNKTCATCHNAGVAGAPKTGSAEDWKPRLEKGKETLYNSANNGLPPTMPAKGMCFNCSDEELKALVDYMIEGAQ
ncbi:MAG: cytochrome c5 family protein [Pseudomonadales bacterium]|nr:cytochrome c5 family protein [Pseudomonadales bacterium]